jgi:hypothetical protein
MDARGSANDAVRALLDLTTGAGPCAGGRFIRLDEVMGAYSTPAPWHPHEHRLKGRQSVNSLALSAAVHCLTGCAIGEMLGMILSM